MAKDDVKDQADERVLDTPPTSQTNLQARLDNDFGPVFPKDSTEKKSNEELAIFATEDTDVEHYVGTDPIYMTHADVTRQPFPFGGVEAEAVEHMTAAASTDAAEPDKDEKKGSAKPAAKPAVVSPGPNTER